MADVRMRFAGGKRKRSNAGRVVKRARRAAAPFRGRVSNGELKFLDTVRTDLNMALAGVVMDDSLNHIAQGNTESERVGRKVTLKMLRMKGRVINTNVTSLTETEQRYRIIVYCDKQANGATAAVTDILETASINSFRNLANQSRFRIIYDKTKNFILPAVAQTAAGTFSSFSMEHNFMMSARLNIPIEFDNSVTTGAIGSIRSNNVGVLALCSTDNGPVRLGYTARIRYSDGG